MSVIAAISNIQRSFPSEVFLGSGELVVILLIISIFIALLISDSEYWNMWASSTLDAITYPLLITFLAIIIYKITILVI